MAIKPDWSFIEQKSDEQKLKIYEHLMYTLCHCCGMEHEKYEEVNEYLNKIIENTKLQIEWDKHNG